MIGAFFGPVWCALESGTKPLLRLWPGGNRAFGISGGAAKRRGHGPFVPNKIRSRNHFLWAVQGAAQDPVA